MLKLPIGAFSCPLIVFLFNKNIYSKNIIGEIKAVSFENTAKKRKIKWSKIYVILNGVLKKISKL